MNMKYQACFPGVFYVDSGEPDVDAHRSQAEIDDNAFGSLGFSTDIAASEDIDYDVCVHFGMDISLIDLEVTRDFRLACVTLLGLSNWIGTGKLRGSLCRCLDEGAAPGGAGSGDAVPAGTEEKWQIVLDPESITGPPHKEPDWEPQPLHAKWRDGQAEVWLHPRDDGAIERIDLVLRRDRRQK